MSMMAVLDSDGTLVGADELTKEIRDQLAFAREDRKRYEPTWHTNLAFAAGKFWLAWDVRTRQLAFPVELYGRELYSTDVITEYRTTALGELSSDDDLPNLLLRRDDLPSEDFQEQLNRAVGWGWDYEWKGDQALAEVRRLCLDLGTAAVRCRFDPTVGPVAAESVPHVDGVPVLDPKRAYELMESGPREDVQMLPIRRGRITWEPLSAFNLLVPPGIPNEEDFPWECVVRPVLLTKVKAEYGEIAADLKEDSDIGSMLGQDMQSGGADTIGQSLPQASASGRLRGHIWLFTVYERSTTRYPDGRMMVFGGNKMKPLRVLNQLPYLEPNGERCSGIAYFHWWRTTGRFWSRSLVEAMKDPQRIVNKRRTQINEIIDRGLPYVIVERNSRLKERQGLPVEVLEVEPQERAPIESKGISPGEWMYHDIQEMRVDLEHATGIRGPRLGENPTNVTTYAQLALLNENDQVKRSNILAEHKLSIAKLVELAVYDMRTYWGPDRQITLASDEEQVESQMFNATKIPPFFIVKVAKGAAKPRSQAAELKKIEDIWNAAIASGAYAENPHDWVQWLKDSLEQGQALDLPEGGTEVHSEKAELENALMIAGKSLPVPYYDPSAIHIPIHRMAQIEADLDGDMDLWQRVEEHVQQHVLVDMESARNLAQMVPEPPMPAPEEGAPPDASQAPQQA